MANKERLKEIKGARKTILDEESFQKKCIFLYSFDELGYLDWLIEQAEKAERYEKTLREIANEQEVGEGDFNADDVANNLIAIAKEALEGKRISDKECEEFVCDYCGTELDETDEYHTTFHTCDKDCYMKMVGLSWSDFI